MEEKKSIQFAGMIRGFMEKILIEHKAALYSYLQVLSLNLKRVRFKFRKPCCPVVEHKNLVACVIAY